MSAAIQSSRLGGRPRLDREARRGERVTVRLRSSELSLLRGLASLHGVSVSVLLRTCALARKLRPSRIPAVNMACVGELNHLGRNLNQLLVLVHTGQAAPGLEAVLDRLLGQMDELREFLVGAGKKEW